MHVMVIAGTRPEAIKMAPVVRALKRRPEDFECHLCAVAQQLGVLESALSEWNLTPDHQVTVSAHGKGLSAMLAGILAPLEDHIREVAPDVVLVQGDTTTVLAGALAGFYAEVPVGHVEAGLRSGDLKNPFPEEGNRVLVDRIASVHFAATEQSRQNLLNEGVDRRSIAVVGNTCVDALLTVKRTFSPKRNEERNGRKMILVTGHRRENQGGGLERVCDALRELVLSRSDVEIAYITHPNPRAHNAPRSRLSDLPKVRLVSPMGYLGFVELMDQADILLTDSGGVQEEGPYLRKPVVVTRECTERPEGVELGVAKLVGTDPQEILATLTALLDDAETYAYMTRPTQPYGDGRAAERICDELLTRFGQLGEPRITQMIPMDPVLDPLRFLGVAAID